jgi:hypothetical protein
LGCGKFSRLRSLKSPAFERGFFSFGFWMTGFVSFLGMSLALVTRGSPRIAYLSAAWLQKIFTADDAVAA